MEKSISPPTSNYIMSSTQTNIDIDENFTQLLDLNNFKRSDLIFLDTVVGKIPQADPSKPALTYKRLPIMVRNQDGTIGELVMPTSLLFSYGPQENVNQTTGVVDGYSMALCLHSKDGATAAEKKFVSVFTEIAEGCKEYVWANKEKIECYDIESEAYLNKLNCLYWKKEKGKIVEGSGPTLYAKLIVMKAKKNKDGSIREPERIVSVFKDYKTKERLDAYSLLNKRCHTQAGVKIESVYFGGGGKAYLQVKLYEALIKPTGGGSMKSLFGSVPAPVAKVAIEESKPAPKETVPTGSLFQAGFGDDEEGSVNDEDEEEEVRPPTPPPVQRKVVRGGVAKPSKSKAAKA